MIINMQNVLTGVDDGNVRPYDLYMVSPRYWRTPCVLHATPLPHVLLLAPQGGPPADTDVRLIHEAWCKRQTVACVIANSRSCATILFISDVRVS